jgi:hypothetical protein
LTKSRCRLARDGRLAIHGEQVAEHGGRPGIRRPLTPSALSAIIPKPICNAPNNWPGGPWRLRPTARRPTTPKTQMLRAQSRFKEAIPEYEIAIALDPSRVPAYAHVSWWKFLTGSVDEALPQNMPSS